MTKWQVLCVWLPSGGARLAAAITVLSVAACVAQVEPASDHERVGETRQATIFCDDQYSTLAVSPPRPYNAVGYLNNGCTAWLIGPNHIVTAAHCLTYGNSGAWQDADAKYPGGLMFYPNFHPDRADTPNEREHVPRAEVIRGVVGTRVREPSKATAPSQKNWEYLMPSDWAIARVENWTDTAGIDLTPIALSVQTSPFEGMQVMTAGYPRHHFPFNGADMEWDNFADGCSWVPPLGGMWAVQHEDPPFFDGVGHTPDYHDCNARWAAGLVHDTGCWIRQVSNDVVFHNCDNSGGQSGSPVLRNYYGSWYSIGVIHGVSHDFAVANPICTNYDRNVLDNMNLAPSAARFISAPRNASNVAMARRTDGAAATAVFAVDSDTNKVVYRERTGSPAGYSSSFSFWADLGTFTAPLTKIAACNQPVNSRPQVFVVRNGTTIYSRRATGTGTWDPWYSFGLPAGVTTVADVDAAYDGYNRCALFMVAQNGAAYVRYMTNDTDWSTSWSLVASGGYKSISAIKDSQGALWAHLLSTTGELYRSMRLGGWGTPTLVARPSGVSSWADVDATWDEAGRAFIAAWPTGGTDRLYFQTQVTWPTWNSWAWFSTHLWTPNFAGAQPAPTMATITASRWMEDDSQTTSPVVFGTDDQGNAYLIEYKRVGTPGWNLNWKSFYHENILYCDDTCAQAKNGSCDDSGACALGTDCTDCGPRN